MNLQRIEAGRRNVYISLCLVSWLLLAIGCEPAKPAVALPQVSAPRELTVAAAADLKFVLGEIIAAFEARNGDIKVNPTFGSSGNFYSQLVNKAPFDLYLSADLAYPQKLIEQGLADRETLFSYAIGEIVVWVTNSSSLDVENLGIESLKDPSVQKIAIANPKHAPYGRAAEAALKQLGIYDQVADRLVLGENVAQAAQFIDTGAADIGLIALSLAMAPGMREKGRFWLVPQSAYPQLEQGGVLIKCAKQPEAARKFRKFLTGEQSRAIFKAHGFQLPSAE